MDKVKAFVIAVMTTLNSLLGILAVPVLLLVGCNIMDYITGLLAAPHRKEEVKSYKSIRGITKKVCMWLLVIVGSFVDILINYATEQGMGIHIPFVVSIFVAVWLVVNEIISILENIIDIGVKLPPFLMPIVKYIQRQVEENAKIPEEVEEYED